MTKEDCFKILVPILADRLCVEANAVHVDAHLKDDLGADSLDTVDVVMAIEDALEISLMETEPETGSVRTFGSNRF